MESVSLNIEVFRTEDGRPTCCADGEHQCRFLEYRRFGQVAVCMLNGQKAVERYDNNELGFSKPNCELWSK
jgi:hypothetical protein